METTKTIDERIEAAARRRITRRQQEEADPLVAARALLQPAVELGRAALARYAAFDTQHGADLRRHAKRITELEYDADGIRAELDRARGYVNAMLGPLGMNPGKLRATLDSVETLTPASLHDPRLVSIPRRPRPRQPSRRPSRAVLRTA
jgi:hypothetical protein